MKRIVIPGLPHHIIQRGLRGQQTFLSETDYAVYLQIMGESCRRHGVEIWAYCLMPDHVHLIAVPKNKNSLSICLRATHGQYTRYINRQTGKSGQFWQGRYSSHLLDEHYLLACTHYIEINPVKREYVNQPEEWTWSSARAHISGHDDSLVLVKPLLERVTIRWQEFLAETMAAKEAELFYLHEQTGRPLGNDDFLAMVEKRQGLE